MTSHFVLGILVQLRIGIGVVTHSKACWGFGLSLTTELDIIILIVLSDLIGEDNTFCHIPAAMHIENKKKIWIDDKPANLSTTKQFDLCQMIQVTCVSPPLFSYAGSSGEAEAVKHSQKC